MPTLNELGLGGGTTLGNLGRTVRGSWYSQLPQFGWRDPQDRPGSAAYRVGGRSIPDELQGIALPSRKTLGQWFLVTTPSGQTHRLQQTDIGPAGWTGRGVDISAAAAHKMGYTPKTFPTDASFTVAPADASAAAGWQSTVGPSAAGVGYVNPQRVAQGATTDPAELRPQDQSTFLSRFLGGFEFERPRQLPAAAPFQFGAPAFRFAPLGGQRRG